MTQYIDKQKIAEQIDRARRACVEVVWNPKNEEDTRQYYLGKAHAYKEMQDFLDTLEVKEVDLKKEINEWQGCEAFPEGCNITPLPKAMNIVEKTAKHFFELGLQVRNHTCSEVKEVAEHDDSDLNRELEEMGIDPNSRYAKMLIDAVYKADALNEIRKKAIRAALNANIDKLWVAGNTIYLKDADPEKAEAFILSLAEFGYNTKELLSEYKKTGKITI